MIISFLLTFPLITRIIKTLLAIKSSKKKKKKAEVQ